MNCIRCGQPITRKINKQYLCPACFRKEELRQLTKGRPVKPGQTVCKGTRRLDTY